MTLFLVRSRLDVSCIAIGSIYEETEEEGGEEEGEENEERLSVLLLHLSPNKTEMYPNLVR